MHDDQEHDLQSPIDMGCDGRRVNRQPRDARHERDSELKAVPQDSLQAIAEAAAGRAAIEAVEAMGEGVALLTMDGGVRNVNGAFAALVGLDKDALNGRNIRELVENANSIIMRITPDHRIVYFNEYAQTFFGYSADEVLGNYVIGTIAPAADAEGHDMHARLKAMSKDPASYQSDEIENMRKDGRRVWIHWSHRAIRDAAGQVREILCVGNDITQRKHLEHEASLYRQRLRRLTDRLVRNEESERRRVASQIHDTVIQSLSLGPFTWVEFGRPVLRRGCMTGWS